MNGPPNDPMNAARKRQLTLGIMVVIILVGWGFATARLGERSLWADEGFTAYVAQQVCSGVSIASALGNRSGSPLHFLVVASLLGFSRSELVLRLPSAFAAVLTLPLAYVLGRKLVDRATGLAAALLLAISPFAIGYAQEARPYALLELFGSLSLLCLVQAMERTEWRWWAVYTISTALLVYTHYFGWLVVAGEVLYASALIAWQTWRQRRLDRRAVALVSSLAIIAILYLPWISSLWAFLRRKVPVGATSQAAGTKPLLVGREYFLQVAWQFGAKGGRWRFHGFWGGALLGALAVGLRKRWRLLLLLLIWFATPVTVLALVSPRHTFNPRHVIHLLPLYLLLTAAGVTAISALIIRALGSLRYPVLRLGFPVALTALLFVPTNLPALRAHQAWEKENWREVAGFVGDAILPDELIYVSPEFWSYAFVYYQPSLEPYLAGGTERNTDELARALEQSAGLWILQREGKLGDPTGRLASWIQAKGFELLIDGYQCGWGVHAFYLRTDGAIETRQADLMRRAESFCPSDPRFRSVED